MQMYVDYFHYGPSYFTQPNVLLNKKPPFYVRGFRLYRSSIKGAFSCNKRHNLWLLLIHTFAQFTQKYTLQFFSFFCKYSFRITRYENYNHSQLSIYSGEHKEHLHNKSNTFFAILIRIFKIKFNFMNKWSFFVYKSGEIFSKWYKSTIFDQNLLNHRLCQ